MNWFSKMERKWGRYAIHNLMFYIIAMYGVGLVIELANPMFYYQYLSLNMAAIFHGQVWRLVTFMIQPPSTSVLWALIALYCYYLMGSALERSWGAFRFNFYFFAGVLGTILAALIIYLITGQSYLVGTGYINLSLFFGMAMTFPDLQFLLFFIIPVKAKWLAIVEAVFYVYLFIVGGAVTRIEIAVSMLNVLVFFFLTRNYRKVNPREIHRRAEFKKQATAASNPNVTRHKCAVCGCTEKTNPERTFRYCSKCNGNYEYCDEHLYTHVHVK